MQQSSLKKSQVGNATNPGDQLGDLDDMVHVGDHPLPFAGLVSMFAGCEEGGAEEFGSVIHGGRYENGAGGNSPAPF